MYQNTTFHWFIEAFLTLLSSQKRKRFPHKLPLAASKTNKMKRFQIILILIILPTVSFAQKKIAVEDPEIEFEFIRPDKWTTFDDEYAYYVYPPRAREAVVVITYVGAAPGKKVEDYFDFALKYVYPRNNPGFEIIETGDDAVDNEKAKWVKFKSTLQGANHVNVSFMFIKHGQRFILSATAKEGDFESLYDDFVAIIKSINSNKI